MESRLRALTGSADLLAGIVSSMSGKSWATVADIELCAILTAIMTWGKSKRSAQHINSFMSRIDWRCREYIVYGDFFDEPNKVSLSPFVQQEHYQKCCQNLRTYYHQHSCIQAQLDNTDTLDTLMAFLSQMLSPMQIGHPEQNSACSRLNMLLRWMVRKDNTDIGIWQTPQITPAHLYAILNTDTAATAIKLGLISYPKYTWQAVIELTEVYRSWDPADPLKYDLVFNNNK